jgi:hypothetical protein
MGTGLRVGVDLDRARPDLLSPDSGKIDRGGAVHVRGLGRIRVELVTRDHLDAVGLPIDRLVLAFVAHFDRPYLQEQRLRLAKETARPAIAWHRLLLRYAGAVISAAGRRQFGGGASIMTGRHWLVRGSEEPCGI